MSGSLSARQHAYLQAMGIDVWLHKDTVTPAMLVPAVPDPGGQQLAATESVSPLVNKKQTKDLPPAADVSQLDWPALQYTVQACTACELHQARTQTVFGTGNAHADWLIVGEAPGAEEDRQGEPFVGSAGQLLNAMLLAIGLTRQHVYIANILKCRPPGNRDPKPEEAAQCSVYLQRQIELIQPKLILAVGRVAAQRLLETQSNLSRLRQKVHWLEPQQIPVIVTYHPAYLLRSPTEKRKAWEDLLFAQNELQRL